MHQIAKLLIKWMCFSFLLLATNLVHATAQFKHIKGYSIDGGLPSATVYSIVELASGHLLLGTDSGMARYNGYEFEVFSKQRGNLILNNASNLFIDNKENLWIGSWGEGLAIYDKHFKLIHHHQPGSGFPRNVQEFFQDNHGTVWVGSADGGLLSFKNSYSRYKQYRHDQGLSKSLGNDRIWKIDQLDPEHIWLATGNGLNRLNIETEEFEHFIPQITTNLGVLDSIIRAMLPSPDKQKILVGTNRNLAVFDIKTQKYSVVNIKNKSLNLGFNHLSYSQEGELLLASIIGLHRADTQKIFANSGSEIHLRSIIDNIDIREMTTTKNNLLWAASRHSGLIKFNVITNPVSYISEFTNNEGKKELIGHIYSFYKDNEGTIWIGTRNNLTYLEKGAILPKHISLKHRFNRITTIAQTPQGQMIIRDSDNTYLLSKNKDKLTPFEFNVPHKRMVHHSIHKIYSQGEKLWIIDNEFSIYRIDKSGYRQSIFPRRESVRLIADTMFNDSSQKLWVAMNSPKIWHQYDAELFDLSIIDKYETKVPSMHQINQDSLGRIYFATIEGVLIYNTQKEVFDPTMLIDNYNNNYISVVTDSNNNLWAANRENIIQANTSTNITTTYGFLDGLNVARYAQRSAIKDDLGRIFFGGADGIDVLEPTHMKVNTVAPSLHIGNIKVNNTDLDPKYYVQGTPLVLKSHQNNINFEFIAVELKQPRLNQYKYKLEGYDDNWSNQSNNRFASYVNLPAGEYTMRYTGSNNSRVWSDKIESFTFTVEESFYNSVYFYALVLMGILGSFYLWAIYNARFHRKRRQFLQSQVNAKTQDLTLLSNIGQKLSACLDDKSIFELLYHHLSERFDIEYFGIARYDKANAKIQYQHVMEHGQLQPSYQIEAGQAENLSSWCINNKQEVIIESPEDISRYLSNYEQTGIRDNYNSMLYLPLLAVDNQVTGCITIQSEHINAYTPEQIAVARTLSSYTAVALNNAQAYSQLEKQNQAIIDAQQQLVQSEKMASLGELTAGVAHEINNPTNFVSVSCQNMAVELTKFQDFINELIEEDADEEIVKSFNERFDELFSQLETMTDGSQRIKTIVQDLRAFSRLEVVERQQVNLLHTVQSTLHLIQTKFIDNVEFIIDIDELLMIECNQSQFNQVIMNIVINGCDAILDSEKARGTITISAIKHGEYAMIKIKDDGSGMSEQTQQKVFQPFFTTKPVGKGTGLGLSISFGIINDHDGKIEVTSEVGKGTCFTISMPLQQKPKD